MSRGGVGGVDENTREEHVVEGHANGERGEGDSRPAGRATPVQAPPERGLQGRALPEPHPAEHGDHRTRPANSTIAVGAKVTPP